MSLTRVPRVVGAIALLACATSAAAQDTNYWMFQ